MSDHVDFLSMIPNGSASSSSPRVKMVGDGVEHYSDYTNLSQTGDAFMTAPMSLLDAQSQSVATSPAVLLSGNLLFPFTSTAPHDLVRCLPKSYLNRHSRPLINLSLGATIGLSNRLFSH